MPKKYIIFFYLSRHASLHDLRGVWYPAGRRVHGDEAAAAQRQPRHQRPVQVRGQRRPPEVSTVQCSTVQYSAVQYSTVQFSGGPQRSVQYSVVKSPS